jgi:hypothetical protein
LAALYPSRLPPVLPPSVPAAPEILMLSCRSDRGMVRPRLAAANQSQQAELPDLQEAFWGGGVSTGGALACEAGGSFPVIARQVFPRDGGESWRPGLGTDDLGTARV